jgi:glycosyltransferase involved in cell wall biosynthesis
MTKKILIVTDNLPDQINGVVTTYKNLETHALLDGYQLVYIDPGQFPHRDCPGYNEVKIAYPRALRKKIEEVGADHYHIATEGPLGVSARHLFERDGIRYNTAYHTRFPEGIKKLVGVPEFITWAYVRWFHKHSGKVLTTTETMVNELRDQGFDGTVISWTRGVDREVFRHNWRDPMENDRPILLCVSRVSKEKNLDDFCAMDYPGARKIMVGDGPYRKELQQKYPDVEFVGFKTGQALAEYYAQADVFVFPSRWETFGLVMIEAMASGTPVAAYPAPGPLDVIDPGVTGVMDENLATATYKCMGLDRETVWYGSQHWSWQRAWEIFRANLV